MDAPLDRLRTLLTLEDLRDGRFMARTPAGGPPGRLFGGQVAAQTLRAATLTVEPDRPVHSLHAYFIRGGRPDEPIELEVDRTRDGRSFTTRQVVASQSGGPIFVLSASFAAAEPGDDWQEPGPDLTGLPDPDAAEADNPFFSGFATMSPFEMRPVRGFGADPTREVADGRRMHPMWVKVKGELPDDPGLHASAIAFISDMGVVGSARAPGSTLPPRFMGASLDHTIWFHRPARADRWLLFSVEPSTNFGGRGLARCTMHTRDGVLVATVMQEALLRDTGQVPLP